MDVFLVFYIVQMEFSVIAGWISFCHFPLAFNLLEILTDTCHPSIFTQLRMYIHKYVFELPKRTKACIRYLCYSTLFQVFL